VDLSYYVCDCCGAEKRQGKEREREGEKKRETERERTQQQMSFVAIRYLK
jgi:hypothetical protein